MRISKIIAALTMLLAYGQAEAAVYKSVDANGNVVYSDEPSKSAQLISLPPITLVPSLSQSEIDKALAGTSPLKTVRRVGEYLLSFASPSTEQTFRKPEPINVQVNVTPELGSGDSISILLDGIVVAQGTSANIVTDNLNRGEHRLGVRVMNQNGQIVNQNSTVVFVQQGSVNAPAQKPALKAK